MANRFEQVDEAVDNAISIVLEQRADGQWAKVVCPMSAHEVVERGQDQRKPAAERRLVRRRQTRQ